MDEELKLQKSGLSKLVLNIYPIGNFLISHTQGWRFRQQYMRDFSLYSITIGARDANSIRIFTITDGDKLLLLYY
jgi:hypothetical protein